MSKKFCYRDFLAFFLKKYGKAQQVKDVFSINASEQDLLLEEAAVILLDLKFKHKNLSSKTIKSEWDRLQPSLQKKK